MCGLSSRTNNPVLLPFLATDTTIRRLVALEWKTFEYRGITYKVSDTGIIIGPRGREIRQRLNSDGYPVVTLGPMRRRCVQRVHRIVALLFVENPDGKPEVNHIDYDRTNNNAWNLEWIDHLDNVRYSSENGRYNVHSCEANGRHRLTREQVDDIRGLIGDGVPCTEIGRMYGVGSSTVYNIKYWNTWK